jgi:hypothetical protein
MSERVSAARVVLRVGFFVDVVSHARKTGLKMRDSTKKMDENKA